MSGRFKAQSRVLTARYLDCLLGDVGSLFLLVGQAPLIGWFCTLVWGEVETETPTLRFILCLASVWFGCISACREVVKERAVFERERFFGLSLPAYVLSKLAVLSGIGLLQVVLLQGAVEWKLGLKGLMGVQLLTLFLAAMAGVALGLLVSSISSTQERAVFAVPLLILPQILFSEFAIPKKYFGDVVAVVEKLMPVRWAYNAFAETASADPSWLHVALDLGVLLAFTAAFAILATVGLLPRRET